MSQLTYKEIRTSLAKEAFAKGFESELKRASQEKRAFAPLLAAAIPVAKFLALNVALPLAIDWGVGKLFWGGSDAGAAAEKGAPGVPQWRPPSVGRSPMGSSMGMGFRPQPVTGMAMGGTRMPGAL